MKETNSTGEEAAKMRKKLPVGIENFEGFSKENFYYVDKTMFIAELLRYHENSQSGRLS